MRHAAGDAAVLLLMIFRVAPSAISIAPVPPIVVLHRRKLLVPVMVSVWSDSLSSVFLKLGAISPHALSAQTVASSVSVMDFACGWFSASLIPPDR